MRKVLPIRIEFEYDDFEDNKEIVQRMYNRIFEMAKQNVMNQRKPKEEIIEKRFLSIQPLREEENMNPIQNR